MTRVLRLSGWEGGIHTSLSIIHILSTAAPAHRGNRRLKERRKGGPPWPLRRGLQLLTSKGTCGFPPPPRPPTESRLTNAREAPESQTAKFAGRISRRRGWGLGKGGGPKKTQHQKGSDRGEGWKDSLENAARYATVLRAGLELLRHPQIRFGARATLQEELPSESQSRINREDSREEGHLSSPYTTESTTGGLGASNGT